MVTVSGAVTCSQPAFVTISGQLKQSHGGQPITGYFLVFVPCDGTTPWNATVQAQLALFHGRSAAPFTGGQANVAPSVFAFDSDSGEFVQRNLSVTITLRGTH